MASSASGAPPPQLDAPVADDTPAVDSPSAALGHDVQQSSTAGAVPAAPRSTRSRALRAPLRCAPPSAVGVRGGPARIETSAASSACSRGICIGGCAGEAVPRWRRAFSVERLGPAPSHASACRLLRLARRASRTTPSARKWRNRAFASIASTPSPGGPSSRLLTAQCVRRRHHARPAGRCRARAAAAGPRAAAAAERRCVRFRSTAASLIAPLRRAAVEEAGLGGQQDQKDGAWIAGPAQRRPARAARGPRVGPRRGHQRTARSPQASTSVGLRTPSPPSRRRSSRCSCARASVRALSQRAPPCEPAALPPHWSRCTAPQSTRPVSAASITKRTVRACVPACLRACVRACVRRGLSSQR
jgi:hypothetical protein